MTMDSSAGTQERSLKIDNPSEKVKTVSNVLKSFREKNPAAVGMTVFGSEARETARPESDIDGYFFVAVDALQPNPALPSNSQRVNQLFQEFQAEVYRNDKTPDKMLQFDLSVGTKPIPLSQELMDKDLIRLVEYGIAMEEHQPGVGNLPQAPNDINVEKLFHPALEGSNLDTYRAYALRVLEIYGEAGERAWKFMTEQVGRMEKEKSASTFPVRHSQSVTEVIEQYKLQDTAPQYLLPQVA